MAVINWYPGHMTKSIRMIEENIKLIDVLVYVLDARAPYSCINPDFERYITKLPVVFVLNKTDLADDKQTEKWMKKLSGTNRIAVTLNSTVSKSATSVFSAIKRLCGDKIAKFQAKGVRTTIKAMVLGVPNTGKSTLINNLIGKSKAITGNKAGVTRGKQWFRVSDVIEVLDTPGTLYPKLANQTIARHLAYLGSIKDEVVDSFELARDLIVELAEKYPEFVAKRYGISDISDADVMLEAVAKARSYVLRGGEYDLERSATAIIDDYRKGRIGKITLDEIKNDD